MSTISAESCQTIVDIVNKNYQYRTLSEHGKLCEILQQFFPALSAKVIKLLSFYAGKIVGPQIINSKQYSVHSFIFLNIASNNPQQSIIMHKITKDLKLNLEEQEEAIFLDYQNYLNCINLGQSSIQQQVNFMHSSQFLCSLPRKKLYQLLRNCKINLCTISQCTYHEGQKIQPGESGSGVYFVRKGDFSYFKRSDREGKQIQTLKFTKGHIFGTLELMHTHQNNTDIKRAFTVKCRSHQAIIFNFSEQTFMTGIRPYCQQYLNQRQAKLLKYLDCQVQKIIISRQLNNSFLSQTLTRRFSVGDSMIVKTKQSQLPILNRTKMSVPLQSVSYRSTVSQQLQDQGLKKTNYQSLRKDGPLKKYPLPIQRSTFTDSQFRDLTRLQRNRQQCQKIKKLKAQGCSSGRGQILFTLFKNSWKFQKDKKMESRRYQ